MSRRRYVDHRAQVASRLVDIDDIVTRANEQSDLVNQAYLMQLAIIKLSGHVEFCFGHMVSGFLEEHSSHRVLAFATRQAERLTNLNPEKLSQLVGAFDPAWKEQLDDFLNRDENRQSLGNLIGARHKLAHGGSTRANAALLTEYRRVAEETISLLFNLFLPLPGGESVTSA